MDSWWLSWWKTQRLDHPAWCVRLWVTLTGSCLRAHHPSKLRRLVSINSPLITCTDQEMLPIWDTSYTKPNTQSIFSYFSSGRVWSQLIAPVPLKQIHAKLQSCKADTLLCCTDYLLKIPPSIQHIYTIFHPFQSFSEHSQRNSESLLISNISTTN